MLREVRERRGLTLADAERETKIRQKYLAALEDDNIAALPGPLYVRGFLRNYALYLGVDPDETLELYNSQSTPTRTKIRTARGEPMPKLKGAKDPERISIAPLSPEKIDTRVRYGTQYVAISLLAIPLIIVFYFIYSGAFGNRSAVIPLPTTGPALATVTPLPMSAFTAAPPTIVITTNPITTTQVPVVEGTPLSPGSTPEAGASPDWRNCNFWQGNRQGYSRKGRLDACDGRRREDIRRHPRPGHYQAVDRRQHRPHTNGPRRCRKTHRER